MTSQERPKQVTLTAEEATSLQERIAHNELTASDLQLVSGLVSSTLWLQQQLQSAKISIARLRGLFGIKTEKKRV